MAKQYRTREGEATAPDTKSQLTTLGSETAPGPLMVPSGKKQLTGILVAAVGSMGAATSSSSLVRLEGPGLPGGPETIAVGAEGHSIATGGSHSVGSVYYPLNVPVTPSNEILIFGEMCGTDVIQISFGVTLVFN
jgi:hypothetical protein